MVQQQLPLHHHHLLLLLQLQLLLLSEEHGKGATSLWSERQKPLLVLALLRLLQVSGASRRRQSHLLMLLTLRLPLQPEQPSQGIKSRPHPLPSSLPAPHTGRCLAQALQ